MNDYEMEEDSRKKEGVVSRPDTRGDQSYYTGFGKPGVGKKKRDTRMARHITKDGDGIGSPMTAKAGRWSRGECVSPSLVGHIGVMYTTYPTMLNGTSLVYVMRWSIGEIPFSPSWYRARIDRSANKSRRLPDAETMHTPCRYVVDLVMPQLRHSS